MVLAKYNSKNVVLNQVQDFLKEQIAPDPYLTYAELNYRTVISRL